MPTFVAEVEARAHDLNILHHMYSAEQIDEMFPTITAAPEIDNAEDYIAVGLRLGRLSGSDHLVASAMCVCVIMFFFLVLDCARSATDSPMRLFYRGRHWRVGS